MTEISKAKPTALTIADELEMGTLWRSAATELRRIHAANLDCMEWYETVKSERDELLEALKVAVDDMEELQQTLDKFIAYAGGTGGLDAYRENIDKVYAVIAKVTN